MSFEIRPTEQFWTHFQELPVFLQEGILDVLESLREHPGELIDRDLVFPVRAVGTRAMRIESVGTVLWFSILFQYDADEQRIHVYDLVVVSEGD